MSVVVVVVVVVVVDLDGDGDVEVAATFDATAETRAAESGIPNIACAASLGVMKMRKLITDERYQRGTQPLEGVTQCSRR